MTDKVCPVCASQIRNQFLYGLTTEESGIIVSDEKVVTTIHKRCGPFFNERKEAIEKCEIPCIRHKKGGSVAFLDCPRRRSLSCYYRGRG